MTQALSTIAKPLKAKEDEAKALTDMMDAVTGPQFSVPSAARQTAIRAFQAACVQMGIREDEELTPKDVAQVGMNALRNVVLADQTVDVTIKLVATELYSLKVWLALNMNSWSEYVDAALLEGENSERWKGELNNPQEFGELLAASGLGNLDKVKFWIKTLVPTVLFNAKEHPVELEDGTQVDDKWIAVNTPNLPLEMSPLVKHLDMNKPEDVEKFQEVLKTAVTSPREEFRNFKKEVKNGQAPTPPPEPTRVEVEMIEVVDVESGEVTHRWRVPEMTFDDESAWNFFWMALQRRYNFVIQTKTERVHHESKPDPDPENADKCGPGRGKSVHPVSRRNGKR